MERKYENKNRQGADLFYTIIRRIIVFYEQRYHHNITSVAERVNPFYREERTKSTSCALILSLERGHGG